MVKFKRNLTLEISESTKNCSGEFTFRKGIYYECNWLSNNLVCVYCRNKYEEIEATVMLNKEGIKKYLDR